MDIFAEEYRSRLGNDNVLMKIKSLIDWHRLKEMLRGTRHPLGQEGYEPIKLFKSLLLGQWHSLSDRDLERALRVRMDFIFFCEFSSQETPDHTTLCRFRNLLNAQGMYESLLNEINGQLEQLNLKLKKADFAVVDATLIASAARPQITDEEIPEDRKEAEGHKPNKEKKNSKAMQEANIVSLGESPKSLANKAEQLAQSMETQADKEIIDITLTKKTAQSKDPDAKWLKKAGKYHYGYKAFTLVDQDGYIGNIVMESANVAECPKFKDIVAGVNAYAILADKAYASAENRAYAASLGLVDGILHKAVRGRPLSEEQKQANKKISKMRFVVEQTFGTMKRRFKFSQGSYMGKDKVKSQMTMKAICMNLLKACNKVGEVFVPKMLAMG